MDKSIRFYEPNEFYSAYYYLEELIFLVKAIQKLTDRCLKLASRNTTFGFLKETQAELMLIY